MHAPTSRQSAEEFFLDHLETIGGITRFVSARAQLRGADAEDFASFVNLRLIENDYAIIRSFEGRSSPSTFLSIVIQRLLLDHRVRQWGRWHPSAEAKRLGPLAIEIERIIRRDGRTAAEALPLCRKIDATFTLERVDEIVARLPKRATRAKPVSLDDVEHELRTTDDTAADEAVDRDRAALSRTTSSIIRDALRTLPEKDALLLRLRFGAEMTVAEVARVLQTPQFPLYAHLRHALRDLRRRLEDSGVTKQQIEEVLSRPDSELDFGFNDRIVDAASVESTASRDEESEGPDDHS